MDSLPLQITTNRDQLRRKVEVDGYTYMVRKPGAGESLTYRQLGREMTVLENKKKLTKAESANYEELKARSLTISLRLFDALDNQEAQDYIDSLDISILLETINQIFGEANIDEPSEAEPSKTDG